MEQTPFERALEIQLGEAGIPFESRRYRNEIIIDALGGYTQTPHIDPHDYLHFIDKGKYSFDTIIDRHGETDRLLFQRKGTYGKSGITYDIHSVSPPPMNAERDVDHLIREKRYAYEFCSVSYDPFDHPEDIPVQKRDAMILMNSLFTFAVSPEQLVFEFDCRDNDGRNDDLYESKMHLVMSIKDRFYRKALDSEEMARSIARLLKE